MNSSKTLFFRRFAWATLAYTVLVILWGAVVRATGSGAGCGSHWPLCNGQVVPLAKSVATVIEFCHRASSGINLVLVVLLCLLAFRTYPKQHFARRGSIISLGFIISEALLGAGLVIFGYVAKDASTARGWVVSAHLINTMLLVASLTLTYQSSVLANFKFKLTTKRIFITLGLILLAATGAVTALGDTLFPAVSLQSGITQDFSQASHLFIKLRTLHPALAIAMASILFMVTESKKLQLVVVLQLILGGLNLVLLAPTAIQITHLLFSNLIWIFWIAQLGEGAALTSPHDKR